MADVAPRVLMLSRAVFPIHGYGGIERHVFHLSTHLLRLGVDLTLVIGRARTPISDAAAAGQILAAAGLDPVPHWRVRQVRYEYVSPPLRPNSILGRQINYPIFSLREGLLARELIARGAIDVVHAQGLCAWGFGFLRRFDGRLRNLPFLANPHGMEEYRTPARLKRIAYAPFRVLYSAGNRAADRAIATDACTQDDLPRYLGVDPKKVVVIPSAIDVDECLQAVDHTVGAELRRRLEFDDHAPVVLSVGRLEYNKGFHILAEALAEARENLGDLWRWVIVGRGKEEDALRRQVAILGIEPHVVFAGALDDRELHSLYEEVDLFVNPTLYEGSSLTTLEGMVHRRPVIASAAGGIPDKVFTGRNGILVPPGDVPALAQALKTALDHRASWHAWGEEGRRIVESTFAWPIVARRTLQEYKHLLELAPRAHHVTNR
jgi:glycosyltransferase involved in cell wall biosynthesis